MTLFKRKVQLLREVQGSATSFNKIQSKHLVICHKEFTVHNSIVKWLFESRKICRHIVNTYTDRGNKYLLGRDLLERSSIEQWIKSEQYSFDPPSYALIFNLAFGFEPDRTTIPESERRLSKVLDVYEQRLGESKFLAGEEFSLADLSHLPNSHYLSKSNKWGHLFDSRKNVKNWCDEMSSRNSWQEVVKILNDYGIGGEKIKGNSKDSSQFPNNKKLDISLPKDDSNTLLSKIHAKTTDQLKLNGKGKQELVEVGIEQGNATDIVSRKEKVETYDQTLAKNPDKDKLNSEQNNNSESEETTGRKLESGESTVKQKINYDTQSGLPGSSSSKQTQEKTEKTRIPQKSTDSTEFSKVTSNNQEVNSQGEKDQTSDMKSRGKEERDAPLEVKKGNQSTEKPLDSESEKGKDTVPTKELAVNKDKTYNELPSKLPTVQSKINGNGKVSTPELDNKETPEAGEAAPELKSKENQDKRSSKEESREKPREVQSMPQAKTPEVANQEENKNRDISGDEDDKIKDNSQKAVLENNDVSDLKKNASEGQQIAGEKMTAESPEKLQDDKSSQTIKEETGPDKGKETTVDLNKQSGTSTESPERLQDDKSSQTIKEETGPDKGKDTTVDLNKQLGTSAESPEKLQDDKSSQTIKEETGPDKGKDTTVDLNKQSGTSAESPEKLQDHKSSQTIKEETGPDKAKDTTVDLNKQSGTSTKSPDKLQDDKSSQTIKEETGSDSAKDTTGDLNKQSGTSTKSPEKLQDDKSGQTNKEETGLDKGKDTTGDSNKQSGTSTESNK